MIQRKKRNSSKVNLTISVIFHTVLILAVFFLRRAGRHAGQEAQGTHCDDGAEGKET